MGNGNGTPTGQNGMMGNTTPNGMGMGHHQQQQQQYGGSRGGFNGGHVGRPYNNGQGYGNRGGYNGGGVAGQGMGGVKRKMEDEHQGGGKFPRQ